MFSHLDRTNLVNKGFMIWLLVKFCLRDTPGSPERAIWLHLARSGSQSQRAIWFILPARGASHIINMSYVTNTFLLVSSSVRSKQLLCFFAGSRLKIGTTYNKELWRVLETNTRLRLVFSQHSSLSQTSTRVSIKQLDYELEISIAW